ncbi:ras/Rap GTPase-activating protein SynGAP isoform X1 [Hemibagrus wyckioides]|uniref:ras/Rap GTPase-activating protein SynGAP isoform X1 n=1 Tax=Hemibagrus wyckioides TaxID=337641 RepID=UPI00266C1AC4|nr:ras/Rap GTPase-activating protein SynGAP isoform X1 [Hemibagrus wyckioides]
MGTDKESEAEARAEMEKDEVMHEEENGGERADDGNLLNTYTWHTEGARGDPSEKSTGNKWSKMQSWRKTLSEDTPSKSPAPSPAPGSRGGGGGTKPASGRKNPFRRALSEPPGSLLSSILSPSSSSSPSPVETGAAADTPQGGKFRKYLRQVSQRLKRPRAQNRNNTSTAQQQQQQQQREDVPSVDPADSVQFSWVPQDVPVWDINNCILQDGQIFISREEEPLLRMRNRASSCLSSLSLQNLTESHSNLECTPDHAPVSSTLKPKTQDGGVRMKIKRRLQGGAHRKLSNPQLNVVGLSPAARFGSRESLSVPLSAAESLDVSSDCTTVIRPVHSSILGEKYCFEVINSDSNHCFGCSSAAERDRWIENLRRTARPNKDNCERTENSLSLWVNEAKGLPAKKRYYCEVYLDGTLFARTSSRAVGKASSNPVNDGGSSTVGVSSGGSGSAGGCQLFWGELFELDNLPPVTQITLHLFRDDDPKKKRHSKDESISYPLGSVALSLANIKGRVFQEKWYPIIPYKPPGTGGAKEQLGPQASIRVKARFQNLQVLPIERYKEFAESVTRGYVEMCSNLEPLLNVRDKEELAGALVHVLQSIGKAKDFLIELGRAEVQRSGENEALIFRENTLATKAIDEYMKLVGQKYLIDTLGDFIARLYATSESCEVDPQKCSASELLVNQRHLKEACGEVVRQITETHSSFPVELNEIFSSWVSDCEERGRADIGYRLISASLFLRFLCPAILSPSLFGLTQPYPEPNTLRTLTLTAKVLQNLANFTPFGEKEEYMLFMNEFLEEHWDDMRTFLQKVSNPDSEIEMAHFDGYVDLPLRLAVLHGLLVDIISPMKLETINNLQPLPSVLNQITEHLGPDVPRITCSRYSAETAKPTYVPPKDLDKYSPLNTSLLQLQQINPISTQAKGKNRKQVTRTQSVPASERHHRHPLKRTTSNTELTETPDIHHEENHMKISPPQQILTNKPAPAPVPWIKEHVQAETSLLEKYSLELCELRLGVDQVTDRELEMAKRLEDFIAASQEQQTQLQAELQELRSVLALREEQLASATFRLGVIEEEREEDERKLSVALVAAERMNVLEEQFARLLQDMQQLNTVQGDDLSASHISETPSQ